MARRFYNAHATDHMKRQVPIAKYFQHQTSGAFSDEHLQHTEPRWPGVNFSSPP